MSLRTPYRNRLPMAYLPAERALLDNPVNAQTKTPAFKKWFGDSVVVDDDRNPMVVYHGTVNDFNVFDSSKVTYSMWAGFGNWFTNDRKYAEVFSKGMYNVGRVIEAYLSIQSPLIYDGDDKYNGFNRMIREFEEVTGKKTYDATPEDAAIFRKYIYSLGFDGVIILQWTGDRKLSEGRPVDIYITLESNQIKSATENRGTFDPADPDIRNPRTIPKQFPYDYAAYLKKNFPDIWKAGGNIRGNDTFRWWSAYRKGDRSPTVMHWWNVTRPAWIARHFRDHRLPGVIAQIKWGTVGTLGVAGMKRVVEDAIRKRYAG